MSIEWKASSRNVQPRRIIPGEAFSKRAVHNIKALFRFRDFAVCGFLLYKYSGLALLIISCSLSVLLEPFIKIEASVNRSFQLTYGPRLSSYSERRNISSGFPFLSEPPADSRCGFFENTSKKNAHSGSAAKHKKPLVKASPVQIGEFHDGLAQAQTAGAALWGIINRTNEWVVPPTFDDVGSFRKGIAPIVIKGRAGFVDHYGRITMVKNPLPPAAYVHAGRPCKTYAHDMSLPIYMGKNYLVVYNEKDGLVDSSGNWLMQPLFSFDALEQTEFIDSAAFLDDELSSEPDWEYFKISRDSKYGVADLNGKIFIQPKYDEISSFNKGRGAVKINGHFGFIDSSGKIVIEPKYDQVTPFEDLIGVESEGRWSLIDSKGFSVKCPGFDGIVYEAGHQWFSNGLGGVRVKKMCGFIDASGNFKIPPTYKFVKPFEQGCAAVWDGTFWQFIDTNGKFKSPTKFASISSFTDDRAFVLVAGPLYQIFEGSTIKNTNSFFESILAADSAAN